MPTVKSFMKPNPVLNASIKQFLFHILAGEGV